MTGRHRCHGGYHFVDYFDDELEVARAYNAAILPPAGDRTVELTRLIRPLCC